MKLAHVEIYVDESGDLGVSHPLSSRYLVVDALVVDDRVALGRIARKARRLSVAKRGVQDELKFNNSPPAIREYVLSSLAASDSTIVWAALDKTRACRTRNLRGHGLFTYLLAKVLEGAFNRIDARNVDVIIDWSRAHYAQRTQLEPLVRLVSERSHAGYFPPDVRMSYLDSSTCLPLQVNDFVVGAAFQHIERGDSRLIELIKDRIVSGRIY